MAPDSTIESARRPRGSFGRYVAILGSLVLHSVLLYAASRAPWPTPASSGAPPVVWLEARAMLPPSKVVPEPPADEPPPEPAKIEPSPPPEPAPPPEPETAPEAEEPTEPERPSVREPSAPSPSGAAPETGTREPTNPPRIDWNEERRRAIASVLEDRERAGDYRTFSLDDVEEPEPQKIEPAPKPMVTDNCVVATNRFARMAAMMIGRCVREPNGDLFAAAKPAYLDRKPVCRETEPDAPGSVTSDGRVLSTVKCELVAEQEPSDLPLDVPR
jgi:hypothetical protein